MDFQQQIDEIDAKIKKLEIEKGVWIKAQQMAGAQEKKPNSPRTKSKQSKATGSNRKNATDLVRKFFLDNGNEPSSKREIADSTGVHQGSVQNVLQNPKNNYEKIKEGERSVKWKVKDSVFKKL